MERRLLEILAASDADGCTDVLLLRRGIPIEMIAEGARRPCDGTTRRLIAGEVLDTKLLITDAGRRSLAKR
jgi:hypothetical protein